jgi:poly(3-hydroxybutyrate) depolymerase
MRVDRSRITVGGLSSGAFMSVQLHVAYSSVFSGSAVFAGGPYYCAQNAMTTALTSCMNNFPTPDANSLANTARTFASWNAIDDLANLTNANVFIYSGSADSVVNPAVVHSAEAFYRQFVTKGNVVTEYSVPSQHCLPTLDYGNTCSNLGAPYINKCGYDGAGKALTTLYGQLNPRGAMVDANLFQFDQTKYGASASISLNTFGYIYVPTACQGNATCGLHVHFHGCQQCTADIGDQYARHGGFNEWAESNNLIVVYPQAVHSYISPSNPQGCFDWWGFTGSDYTLRSGKQIAFTKAVVDAIVDNFPHAETA